MIQDLSSVILGISDNLHESNRQAIFNRPAGRCDHCPAAHQHKSTIKSHENHEILWTNCEVHRRVREISTKMQRELEKRKKNEPYKKKNVQNLKEGENKWESKEVAEWVAIFPKKTQNMQSDYILFCINISKSTRKALIILGFWKKQKLLLFIREGTIWRKCPRYARSALSAAGALVWIRRNLR